MERQLQKKKSVGTSCALCCFDLPRSLSEQLCSALVETLLFSGESAILITVALLFN